MASDGAIVINWQRWAEIEEFARPDQTLCDYDTRAAPSLDRVWMLARMIGARPLFVRLDRTVRGWHLVIRWNREFSPAELIAMQAILGSDYKRESYNLARVLGGNSGGAAARCWNLLFRRKL